MRLDKTVAQFVARERICRVSTTGRAGVPHVVPVCHVLADGKVYFGSETDARKVRNLRENPHATLEVDLYSDDWANLKGVMLQATAAIIPSGARFKAARKLLYAKYPQYPDESALEERESVIIELTPRHVFTWGFE
jgi:nitroimidazol reductase NimA-like FMN-containing flavoprotein (pyridoxamine 5'-phosphate oxidase superfamily)